LTETAAEAKSAGFSRFRVTGEMTWVLGNHLGTERLREYEAKLNYFFSDHDVSALCQYNYKRFTPEIILDAIHTHPIVIYDGIVCRNIHYIPPDEFLKTDQITLEVRRLLKILLARERAMQLLR
jgi:hypothetical protein